VHQNQSLDTILGIICSVFDAYSSVLFLKSSGSRYALASYFSLGDNISQDTRIKPGTGLVGWIIRNNRPLLINKFDRNAGCLGYYDAKGESKIKAFMGCPLSRGLGVLCLDSKKTYSFSERDQKILHQFAQLIESIIGDFCRLDLDVRKQNYYHFLSIVYGLREKYPRWKSFLERLLKVLSQASDFEYAFLVVRDEFGKGFFLEGWNKEIVGLNSVQKFSIDTGLLGWIFKNGSAIFSGDQNTPKGLSLFGKDVNTGQFKSIICLPLIVHKKTRGVLVLGDLHVVAINDELKIFVQMVAEYLALFLENLYLKNKLRNHTNN